MEGKNLGPVAICQGHGAMAFTRQCSLRFDSHPMTSRMIAAIAALLL